MGTEAGGDVRDNEEMNGEKKMILEKLLDRDEEEPEVGQHSDYCLFKCFFFFLIQNKVNCSSFMF